MTAPADRSSQGFFGRDAELTDLGRALERHPFVLLHGPGGAGKTRLARVFLTRTGQKDAPFCDLSSLMHASERSEADVVAAIAAALGIALSANDVEGALEQLAAAFDARGDGVVVLDNLEGVEAAARAVVDKLLGRGPRILGTSRVKLGHPREHDLEVGPLAHDAALQLFSDRARKLAPEFEPEAATAELVRKLEGSPLAIELAAARAHVLPPRELLQRLSRSLDTLRSDAPGLPARHRSLRAVVTGSWELCTPADQRALALLSVFRGGFDLEAAEAVIGDEAADRIEALLASSLMQRSDRASGPMRFALYESVRELAAERLAEDAALAQRAREQHAAHYHAFAERHADRARDADPTAVARLAREADNLLAALRFAPRAALAHGAVLHRTMPAELHVAELAQARARLPEGDAAQIAEAELALSKATRRLGSVQRAQAQARRALEAAEVAGRPALVAEAHYMTAVTLYDGGALDEARAHAERAVALTEACDDPAQRAQAAATLTRALDQLGFCALEQGDFELATRSAERVIALSREHGLRMVESFAENLLSAVSRRRGRLDLAERHLRRGIALIAEVKHPPQETILRGNLGRVLLLAGDLRGAEAALEEALALARAWGQRKTEVAHWVNLATVFADAGRNDEARARAAHAEALARSVEHRRIEAQAAFLLGALALDDGRFDDARADFQRSHAVAALLGSAPARDTAQAGLAAALACMGRATEAAAALRAGREGDAGQTAIDRAQIDACAAIVASASGDDDEHARSLAAAEMHAPSSVEVRLLLRAARACVAPAYAARPSAPPSVAPSSRHRFELITRGGLASADELPGDADLAFDAIERRAIVDGAHAVDLRKKPVAARLLEVLLGAPSDGFDKARLYRDVWHGTFRNASQGAAVYKAVDRLARLLDDDPRRFLCWNEEGCLVLVARRPALLRAPTG